MQRLISSFKNIDKKNFFILTMFYMCKISELSIQMNFLVLYNNISCLINIILKFINIRIIFISNLYVTTIIIDNSKS